jgi:hypothetical protein
MKSSPGPFVLDHQGLRLRVELRTVLGTRVAVLVVDEQQVDEQIAPRVGATRLHHEGKTVVVVCWWPERIARCFLIEPGAGDQRKIRKLEFVPPAGSAAATFAAWKAEHPRLYASRHVALAVLEILGIGALLGALLGVLLPRIPWRLPDWDLSWLPEIDLPNVWSWIPHIGLPNILQSLAPYKWVVLLVIAVLVAVVEVERNRRRATTTRNQDED